MATAILTFDQTPDQTPEHYVGAALTRALLAYRHNGKRAVELVREGLLWIRVNLTLSKLKALVRGCDKESRPRYAHGVKAFVPATLPPAEVENTKYQPPELDREKATTRRFHVLAANAFARGSAPRPRFTVNPSKKSFGELASNWGKQQPHDATHSEACV